jgi:hypothetical protein
MTNNKQQTAVEWFNSKIKQLEFWVETRQITWKEYHKEKNKLFEQAKEMHKKEMVMFVLNVMGKYRNGDVLAEVATDLYEQTYGGGEQ